MSMAIDVPHDFDISGEEPHVHIKCTCGRIDTEVTTKQVAESVKKRHLFVFDTKGVHQL